MTRVVTAPFSNTTGPGPLTVPEAQVGDLVLFVIDTVNGYSYSPTVTGFAAAVIVDGEILTDLNPASTPHPLVAILDRESPKTISISGTIS